MTQRGAAPPLDALFEDTVFQPQDGAWRLDALVDLAQRHRIATFAAFVAQLREKVPRLAERSGVAEAYERFMAASGEWRRLVVDYPPFRIWLRYALQAGHESGLELQDPGFEARLHQLDAVINRAEATTLDRGVPRVAGVELRRYDVDPLLQEASPPTFDFAAATPTAADDAYPLEFFREVASVALERIKATWPPAYDAFPKFVRTIIHLPQAGFRSASANRYAGAIFLTGDDATLLDLEESLLHECGHQMLYTVMELDRIVTDGSDRQWRLPWSDSQRDYYGYFHAFYIYVILARYLEQIAGRTPDEQMRARGRLKQILHGLGEAVRDHDDRSRLTERGADVACMLRKEVAELSGRHIGIGDAEESEPIHVSERRRRLLGAGSQGAITQ